MLGLLQINVHLVLFGSCGEMGHIISENPRLGSIRCKRGGILIQTDLHRIDYWKAQLVTADCDDRRHGLLDRLDLIRTRRPNRWCVGYREDLWWFGQVTRRGKQNQERYQRRWPLQADWAPRRRANLHSTFAWNACHS